MELFCLGLIIFSIIVIVVGIIELHELPGKIAKSRGHPQVDAIKICSLLGLIIFPFWMFALLWAHMKPIFAPLPESVKPAGSVQSAPAATEGAQA
jgi:hypothetical protein